MMNLTIKTTEIVTALKEVKKTIDKRGKDSGFIDRFQIVAKNGTVVIAGIADSGDAMQQYTVDDTAAMIDGDGGFLVPFSMVEKIAKKFKNGFTTFKYDSEKGGLIVSHDSDSFILRDVKEAGELYSILDDDDDKKPATFETEAGEVIRSIGSVLKSVSKQESRPVLTGVNLERNDGGKIRVVATDSHRLTRNYLPVAAGDDFNVIIPGNHLKNITMDLKKAAGAVRFTLYSDFTAIEYGRKRYTVKNVEGNYPSVDRLIPTDSDTTLQCNAGDLLAAIDTAGIISKDSRNNCVKLSLDDDGTTLTATSPDSGDYTGKVDAVNDGESLEISFNPDYLSDAIKDKKGAGITINFTTPLRPFTIESEQDKSLTELVTPMRVY